ncbi:ribosome-binding factor A [Tissierellia bacterium S5-A11]|nr:ribosome-binding factor A [Tissierellia bacterium S5-A11]
MKEKRLNRITEEIKRELSNIIQNKLKDPRVHSIVSVNQVDLAGDLSQARIGISTLGTPDQQKETLEGIQSAKGFIKKELGRQTKLRAIPELIFYNDTSIEKSIEMFELIQEVNHGKNE